MGKVVRWSCASHSAELPGVRPIMVTLTYEEVTDWRPFHISLFLGIIRQWLKRRGIIFRYVWVAELQDRGAVHYHVLIWVPHSLRLPKPDRAQWWTHGSTRIERTKHSAVAYISKYVSKTADAVSNSTASFRFPKGCRIYGHGGLTVTSRMGLKFSRLHSWLRRRCPQMGQAVRIPKIGWIDSHTGEVIGYRYRVEVGPSGVYLIDRGAFLPEGIDTMIVEGRIREAREQVSQDGKIRTVRVSFEVRTPLDIIDVRCPNGFTVAQMEALVDKQIRAGIKVGSYRDQPQFDLVQIEQSAESFAKLGAVKS